MLEKRFRNIQTQNNLVTRLCCFILFYFIGLKINYRKIRSFLSILFQKSKDNPRFLDFVILEITRARISMKDRIFHEISLRKNRSNPL